MGPSCPPQHAALWAFTWAPVARSLSQLASSIGTQTLEIHRQLTGHTLAVCTCCSHTASCQNTHSSGSCMGIPPLSDSPHALRHPANQESLLCKRTSVQPSSSFANRRAGCQLQSVLSANQAGFAASTSWAIAAARRCLHTSRTLLDRDPTNQLRTDVECDGADSDEDMIASSSSSVPHLNSNTAAAMQALEQLSSQAGQDALEQHAAKEVMSDPMARLMASQGMPLGIAVSSIAQENQRHHASNDASDSGDEAASLKLPAAPNPAYSMEALDEIFHMQAAESSSTGNQASGGSSGASAGGRGHGSRDGSEGDDSKPASVPQVDSWGTTRESPAEIARRLVESNAELEREAARLEQALADDGMHTGAGEPSEEPVDEQLPAPGEEKYKTLEQMSADIKGLDEVFEVLAQVPWLDEADVQQKELKGVAMVGLLGTLEEVGFNIRDQVLRIWSGDHDDSMILECNAAKDQAALISILFHTKKIQDEFGDPDAYLPAPAYKPAGTDQQPQAMSAALAEQLLGVTRRDKGGA